MTCWSQILASKVRPDFSKAYPPFGFSGRRPRAANRRFAAFVRASMSSYQSMATRCPARANAEVSTIDWMLYLPRRLASADGSCLPECARFRKPRKVFIVIAERLAQNVLGVLAEQRRRYGVNHRGQAHIERCFDVGHRTRGRVRDPA